MTVPFLEARFGEYRTPRWDDATPVSAHMVCGAAVIPGRTYCPDCRHVLIAGVIDKDGRACWFDPAAGARWRRGERQPPVLPHDRVITNEPKRLSRSPNWGSGEVITPAAWPRAAGFARPDEEAEPEGDRPLQPRTSATGGWRRERRTYAETA